ncbi:hypothetical protein E3N88_15911 [Mikania micrantha]|uniref:Uncharacterized protein n=1 Tax=Mikania micrantha TaxID=192012 RepID=A0A5N6NYL6_9ASTR|nr:hypothetical protein E3N88_15165 [Mikania micrantha]KAD5508208.1 hypothetical protein E3N88_15911 [Mikania micrantha]
MSGESSRGCSDNGCDDGGRRKLHHDMYDWFQLDEIRRTPSDLAEFWCCVREQCASLDISACRSNQCLYQVSYVDRSFTVGNFVMETVGAMVEVKGL